MRAHIFDAREDDLPPLKDTDDSQRVGEGGFRLGPAICATPGSQPGVDPKGEETEQLALSRGVSLEEEGAD